MFAVRTDLASELAENGIAGFSSTKQISKGVEITTVTLAHDDAQSGKRAGVYMTADIGRIWECGREEFERAAAVTAELIARVMPAGGEKSGVLAVGLGNGSITGDAIGPRAVAKMLVTKHIKGSDPALYAGAGFGCLAAFAPGVLGQTGIESSELVRCAAKSCGASCVIVIDALASRKLARLGTTVQITDSGISPGSGVYNDRRGLDRQTLGIPVIAVGVPTVVDAATLAHDLLEQAGGRMDEATERAIFETGSRMFVSPKECDVMTEKISRFLADAVDLAVHRELTLAEMQEYTA